MLRFFAAVVVATMATACASFRQPAVAVHIEELTAGDRWRATIVHAEPADTFVFSETRQPFRDARWSIIEPQSGAFWTTQDGYDGLVIDRPVRTVVVDFESDFSFLEKDYRLNVPFTDGSRLLYTGHFRTRAKGASSLPPHRFTFKTSADRPIRILDRSGPGRMDWSSRDDTYVYFGDIRPESSDRMTLIVDPGLPPWIEEQMRGLIPRQFDYFATAFGQELPFKPLILVSYGGSAGPGRTFSAGGLQGLLEIGVSGEQWMPRTPEAERDWFRQLAHEVFHLWGAQANRHDRDAEWLSEAAAEYGSMLATLEARVFDEAAARRLLVDSANLCIDRLRGTPLRKSLGPGQSRNVYTCGLVSQKIVDAAARATGSDIWSIWRRTYTRTGRPYTTADHLDTVRSLENPRLTDFLDELVNRGLSGNIADRLAEQLRAAGVDVRVVEGRLR